MRGLSTSPPILPLYSTPSLPALLPAPFHPHDTTSSATISHTTPHSILSALQRQTVHLQQTLQQLLDAQSHGLLAGLGRAPSPPVGRFSSEDGNPSRSSSVATSGSTGRASSSRTAGSRVEETRSARREIGLQGARRGIKKALRDLSGVKAQEATVISSQAEEKQDVLHALDAVEKKRTGIEDAIQRIDAHPTEGSAAVGLLVEEERGLDRGILEAEERLRILRAQRTRVRNEREQRENRLQAKLSSWQESLREVEREIRASFLDVAPGGEWKKGVKGKGVWSLPKERRTVELVNEQVEAERKELVTRLEGIEREREACMLGGDVWNHVMMVVGHVEVSLKKETERLRVGHDQGDGEGMQGMLNLMDEAIPTLEEKLAVAEEKEWNLLVCCIGAELEALREGREMLKIALGEAEGDLAESDGGTTLSPLHDIVCERERGDTITKDEGMGFRSTHIQELQEEMVGRQSRVDRVEEDDDEPGPELLFSHQEED